MSEASDQTLVEIRDALRQIAESSRHTAELTRAHNTEVRAIMDRSVAQQTRLVRLQRIIAAVLLLAIAVGCLLLIVTQYR